MNVLPVTTETVLVQLSNFKRKGEPRTVYRYPVIGWRLKGDLLIPVTIHVNDDDFWDHPLRGIYLPEERRLYMEPGDPPDEEVDYLDVGRILEEQFLAGQELEAVPVGKP